MLKFSLFRIPVTIRVSFLLVALFLGLSGGRDTRDVAAWVGIVFVSILIHELGHAFTARFFGAEVAIELNAIGGLTRWGVRDEQLSPGRRALVAAAGSAVGVLFGGIIWLVAAQFGPYSASTSFVIGAMIYVNLFWGLLNWLPIRPLDGGHLLLALLEKTAPNRGETIAKVVFIVTAGIGLVVALQMRLFIIALVVGWLLVSEFNMGRAATPRAPIPPLSYDQRDDEMSGIIDIEPEPEEPSH